MSLQKMVFRPGVVSQLTATLNEGGWSDAALIRFRDGIPEKRGGWVKATLDLFDGICRGLWSWVQLDQVQVAALGTHTRLYIFRSGQLSDITPIDVTGTLAANPFSTTIGSSIVLVTHITHGRSVGDIVIFTGATPVGGLTINGEYVVVGVVDGDHYQIDAGAPATSTATGGGAAVAYTYLLPVGNESNGLLLGWGAGPWGGGASTGWGMASTFGISTLVRTWSLDNWGEELIANPRGRGVYRWRPLDGLTVRATILAGAPTKVLYTLVSLPVRQLVCLGAEVSGTLDPLLIRWSDTQNYNDFIASSINTAGSFRLSSGNTIVCGQRTTKVLLVWTDSSLWTMRYIGLPFVYAIELQATDCGSVSPNAAVAAGDRAYWMSTDAFFMYGPSSVSAIPCTVWRDVFTNINKDQLAKVYARVNHGFNEVIWYYPSAGSDECDSYVSYNYAERVWDKGLATLQRTAGLDNDVFTYPLVTDTNGQLYFDENGYDRDGVPLGDFVQSGYVDIGDGQEFLFIDKFFPDLTIAGQAEISIVLLNEPMTPAAMIVKGPFLVQAGTRFIPCRARARQAAMRIASVGLGSYWRLGATRYRAAPSGRR